MRASPDNGSARLLVSSLRAGPYPRPGSGHPFRLVFVGQSTFFEACALDDVVAEISTSFVDFRAGADPERMLADVESERPHAVVVFRPELVPKGLFHGLACPTVGFLTEPIPRKDGPEHPDLARRLADLRATDESNFDRIISFDPLIAETAGTVAAVWRSLPLPVADRYYRPVRPLRPDRRAIFIGRSTPHRETMLTPAKHRHDLLHLAHGVDAAMLEALLDEHDVGVNLHNEPYPSFENRVCLHLAAGHLVLSEPLSPTHGLEPGIDFVEVRSAPQLEYLVGVLQRFPTMYDGVRIRGRAKAELFRASAVYPRLIHDLYLDLAAHGPRSAAAA